MMKKNRVSALAAVAGTAICAENPPLYEITFTARGGGKQGFDVTGDYCPRPQRQLSA
jgi:hypothetical protein